MIKFPPVIPNSLASGTLLAKLVSEDLTQLILSQFFRGFILGDGFLAGPNNLATRSNIGLGLR
jgi:hypothetical protein